MKNDGSGEIEEWGECLDSCPTEEVNAACLSEPIFPIFADGTTRMVNYTATYDLGSGLPVEEVFFSKKTPWNINQYFHVGFPV